MKFVANKIRGKIFKDDLYCAKGLEGNLKGLEGNL